MSEEFIEGTWADLHIHPGRLTKLVAEGKAEIIGRDPFGRRIYRMKRSVWEKLQSRWVKGIYEGRPKGRYQDEEDVSRG